MNCKPGDLAVIVRRTSGAPIENIGAVVEVTEFAGNGFWWVKCSRMLKNQWGDGIGCCADADLQPIRPPGEPVEERCSMGVPA